MKAIAGKSHVLDFARFRLKYSLLREEQVKAGSGSSTPHTYNLVLVPRRTALCDKVLEEEGVLGELTISSYKLEFIPVEDDLLSLEWDSTFKDIFLVRIRLVRSVEGHF